MLMLIWGAAIGQTLFVAMWLSMPFWRSWIGGALMTKSAALMAVLWFWLIGFYSPEYPYRDVVREVLIGLVTVGIWWQVFALAAEIRESRRARSERP